MDKKALEQKVYLQKLSFLYSELPKGVFATLFLGLILVFILREDVPIERLTIWYTLTVLVSLVRMASFFYFRSDQHKDARSHKHFRFLFLGTLVSGLLWGSSSVYIFPQSDELKLIVIFFIAGLSAGATGALAPIFKVYATFVLAIIIPFVIVFSLETSSYALFISVSLIFYLLLVSSTALKINQNFDKTLRLGFENEDLVEELKTKAHLAQQANEAKSVFLSAMSHEIRTPLNAILGYISILRKKERDEEKQHQLKIIDHSSHLLLGIINDILDYNKITGGKLKLENIPCNLKDELEQLVELFLPMCTKKDLILRCEIDGSIPLCIKTDILRLKQILTNLLSNAVKFTPQGKKIVLKSRYQKPNIYFEVVDEGIGVDEEQQKIIFESFQQADSSTTRKYGGTGLGLAISYQLSLLFNTSIKLKSTPNEGSTFFFNIEVDVCEGKDKEIGKEIVYFDHEKVLVAEDNKTNQMLIRLLLEDLNLDVVMVSDGKEAVESYKNDFSLVLMDINMPNMNGKEAMLAIKQKHPESKVVALTANALSGDKDDYLGLGFDGYLSKPIDADLLMQLLDRMIRSKDESLNQ